MNTNIATTKTFEQKMSDRIKDGIGDLITDEELKKILDRSMEEIFFTLRPNPRKTYSNNEPEKLQPFLYDLIKELMLPQLNILLKEYLAANQEEVMKALKEVVTAGAGQAMINALNSQFQTQFHMFQSNIQNQINRS